MAGSYFSSQDLVGSSAESNNSDAHGRTRSYNIDEYDGGVLPIETGTAAGGGSGSGGDGGAGLFSFRLGSAFGGNGTSGKAEAAASGGARAGSGAAAAAAADGGAGGNGGRGGEMPPPPPRPPSAEAARESGDTQAAAAAAAAAAARFPDPFQQSRRLSGLPENEEVVPESPRPSLEAKQARSGKLGRPVVIIGPGRHRHYRKDGGRCLRVWCLSRLSRRLGKCAETGAPSSARIRPSPRIPDTPFMPIIHTQDLVCSCGICCLLQRS